jgi:hypothetical protein
MNNQLIKIIKRYPFQVWIIISNLGIFTWLQVNATDLARQGEKILAQNHTMLESLVISIRNNPVYILLLGILVVVVLSFLKNIGRIIFTILNLVLLLKILRII